jgi:4-hydroxybenzoate polyprenyltransferase
MAAHSPGSLDKVGEAGVRLFAYVKIARADHWFKNVFMLPGTALAAFLSGAHFTDYAVALALGVASVCLVASANYVLNEWLDAEFDRFHPVKKNRPSVVGDLNRTLVYAEYAILTLSGFGLALLISPYFLGAAFLLWFMAILYNVKPSRTKDRVYLDVLSESINNPLRLLLGWFAVTASPWPPVSLILAYWMLGAYMMAIKRYAEMRMLGPETAARYRRSFRDYTVETLLISVLFYASAASLGSFSSSTGSSFSWPSPFWPWPSRGICTSG